MRRRPFCGDTMLEFLNIFFFVFHTFWVVFICIGWIWKRLRPWHLGAVLLTALSWFVLGIWYGWGYCLCTDWHYRVLEELGRPEYRTYSRLLIETLTRLEISPELADGITVGTFAVAAVLSVALNVRDYYNGRSGSLESVPGG
jgi:uncharacterized protein DUF2784